MGNALLMRVRLRCPQEHTSATGFTLPDDPSDPSQKVVIALKGVEGKPQPPAEIECDCYMAAMGRYPNTAGMGLVSSQPTRAQHLCCEPSEG